MSGVEAAGLVLGSLPLLISALEHYADGISSIQRWRRYKREWANLALQLDVEAARFRVTCEKLLDGIVSAKMLNDLIEDPGGKLWGEESLERRLNDRLQVSYWPYLRSVKAMDDAIRDILSKLEYDENGKPLRGEYSMFKEEYKRLKFSLSRKNYDASLSQIRNSNDMLANLTNQNMELEPSRQKRKRSGQHFKTVQKQAKNLYEAILSSWSCECNGHCVNLGLESRTENIISADADSIRFKVVFSYESEDPVPIGQAWQEAEFRPLRKPVGESQSTVIPPSNSAVSLDKLDRLTKSPNGSTFGGKGLSLRSKPKKEVKFRPDFSPIFRKVSSESSSMTRSRGSSSSSVIQSKSDITQTLQIHGVDSSSTLQTQASTVSVSSLPPYTERADYRAPIESLCRTMQLCYLDSTSEEQCLGYLRQQQEDTRQCLGLYLSKQNAPQSKPDVTSLGTLLSDQPNQLSVANLTAVGKPPMNWGERLGLALTLASSVLQLYMTPWLQEYWDKNDIFINEACKKNIRQHSFVRRKFQAKTAEEVKESPCLPIFIQNKSIFALGIVLIELSLGQSLASMRLPEDLENGQPTPWTDLVTANRLLEAVYGQAGTRYGDAVRRCIRCEFDHRNTSLDDDGFRQAVYDGVVAPLEDDFRVFFQS